MKKIIVVLITVLFLSGCSGEEEMKSSTSPNPCPIEQLQSFLEAANDLENEFKILSEQADKEKREELEPIIKKMQDIESDAQEVSAPPCALKAKSAMVSYLETMIQGYFKLYTEAIEIPSQSDKTADEIFDLANSKFEYFKSVIEELQMKTD